jgi:nitronate monooxygenase
MRTELLERLEIDAPIFQAPMAGVATPEMAAAVANAGGLGALGAGATDAAGAAKLIAAFRARSRRSLQVNVFCHAPPRPDAVREAAWIARLRPEFERVGAAPPPRLREIYGSFLEDDAMLELFVAERPKVVSFHFGVPAPSRVAALRGAGIILFGSATSLDEGRALAAAGVDAIVAQGYEAGGHRGVFDPDADDAALGTLPLVRLLVRSLDRPVIAAGGIMDGAGIAAALRLGAVAAQLGTAFVASDESAADAGYRALLATGASHRTTMTRAVSGRPARSLPTRLTEIGLGAAPDAVPAYPIAYDAGKALHTAAKAKGSWDFGAYWAGQGAPLSRPMPAGELTAKLRRELDEAS